MPLVLRNVDLASLGLTPEQMQAIEKVRQDFLQQTGGANQNSEDANYPAYLARWQKAQIAADSMFRVTLGSAYWKYLMIASAQASSQN
jgi:hypothetical protein